MRYFHALNFESMVMKNMELTCEKYDQKMDSEAARCQHPDEYCKFRSSCIIHYIGKEQARESNRNSSHEKEKDRK